MRIKGDENVKEVVELAIKGLGAKNITDVKKLIGAKHVINAEIEHDNLTGFSTGQGKVAIRLGKGEQASQIIKNLNKAGIRAS